MKIVILIPCILQGGTEIQTLNLSNVLQSFGYKVIIICYFEYDQAMVKEFEKRGTDIRLLNLGRGTSFIRLIVKLKKELRSLIPDLVNVQYMAPGALPILAARLGGVRIVFATVHQPWTKSHGYFAKLILRASSLLTTRFIAVSINAERSWFGSASHFDEHKPLNLQPYHFTIHNAVDTEKITGIISGADQTLLKMKLNIPDNRIIIGAVSRLRTEKGIDLLIRSFSLIAKEHQRVHLLIVGSGPDEERMKKEVVESGLSSLITFYGQTEWEKSMELLALMDIMVVPSHYEGFGLSAAEAMAAGKPVIASDTSGLKEVVIHGQTGLLFPVDNQYALKEALEELIKDASLRQQYGNCGKKRVETHFSLELFKNKINALYSNYL